jgi:hypothetical protein
MSDGINQITIEDYVQIRNSGAMNVNDQGIFLMEENTLKQIDFEKFEIKELRKFDQEVFQIDYDTHHE